MKKSLKAGAAAVDISPKEGIELAGYPHYLRHNTGVHDPLYAGCIYLNNGENEILLITLDILMYSKKYVKESRERISQKTSIPKENIMISCSHTHSGPWASGRLDLDALEAGLTVDEEYVKGLNDKIEKIALEAYNNTFDAKIGIEKGVCGKEKGIGGNRRDPEGLADPEVWTIGVQDDKGNWRACMVKYALHPTLIHADSTVVTADYPGYIRKYFEEKKPGMVFLFAQGTSGDQSTRYFRNGQTFEEAERFGRTIGAEADKVLESMELSSDVDLVVKSTEVDIHIRELPSVPEAEKAVKEAKENYEKIKAAGGSYIEVQNANLVVLGAEDLLGYTLAMDKGNKIDLLEDETPAEVQVLGIGDARIVGLQGEVFVDFGLAIQEKSPFEKTFVVELANGCMPGYAYNEEAYLEGGYETDTSLLTHETGDMLVDTAVKLLNQTK
ncbi:MAG: hypothetical protein PHP06_09425 [Clostridia bacterium]|nr:hypothetical protein [Clostridia bacterium]